MANKGERKATTKEKVEVYQTTSPLLVAMYQEIQILSKKKPDGTLNAGKVKLINRLLSDIKDVLEDEPDIKYLDLLSDDDLPQYSDVVLILSQFSTAFKRFKEKYYRKDKDSLHWKWIVEE